MNLNEQSPIQGKTWGRCSKAELAGMIERLAYQNQYIMNYLNAYKLKTAWLPDDV